MPAGNPAAVVMAGGLGTRMRSATPKHLHPLLGRRLVDWVIGAAQEAGADPIVVVAVQETALGTGDAVRSARDALTSFDGDVLVLNGDVPGLTGELLHALVE